MAPHWCQKFRVAPLRDGNFKRPKNREDSSDLDEVRPCYEPTNPVSFPKATNGIPKATDGIPLVICNGIPKATNGFPKATNGIPKSPSPPHAGQKP